MSRARQRTLSHLQKLAATAAVLGSTACNHGCGSGYAVVDPMPMPTPKYSTSITASATWSGTRIVLELKDPTLAGASFAVKSPRDAGGDAGGRDGGLGTALGGTIASASPTADGMRFELEPDPGRGGMSVDVDVDGPDGVHTVGANVSWGSSADGGKTLGVTIVDR